MKKFLIKIFLVATVVGILTGALVFANDQTDPHIAKPIIIQQ